MELSSKSETQAPVARPPGPANGQIPFGKDGVFGPPLMPPLAILNGLPHCVRISKREQEVLRWLATGKSNKEISSLLDLSVKTVETYRSRLMLKLQAPSLVHMVHYAIRHRIVEIQG